MRDTYADTSLAQRDLGFAPTVSLEEGIQAEYRWLASSPALYDARCLRTGGGSPAVHSSLLAAPAAARPSGRRSRRPARSNPTSSCSSAATRRSTRSAGWSSREYFRQLVDSYPQSQYRADAKLGLGDTYLGEKQRRIASAGDQRVPGVPQLLPDAHARRLRAVQAGDGALQADARRRCATRPRRATRSASSRPSSTRFPNKELIDEAQAAKLREAKDRLDDWDTGVARALLPDQVVSRRRSAGWCRCSRTTPSTRGATSSTSARRVAM